MWHGPTIQGFLVAAMEAGYLKQHSPGRLGGSVG